MGSRHRTSEFFIVVIVLVFVSYNTSSSATRTNKFHGLGTSDVVIYGRRSVNKTGPLEHFLFFMRTFVRFLR